MSSTGKTWTAIIIVIVIVVIGWLWYRGSSTNPAYQAPATTNTTSNTSSASLDAGVSMSASSDTSNAALQQDLSATDAQMNNLSADQSAAANASAQ